MLHPSLAQLNIGRGQGLGGWNKSQFEETKA